MRILSQKVLYIVKRPNGCSFVPDFGYRSCCDSHDRDYIKGGTEAERVASDLRLRECIEKCGNRSLAYVYWMGVRMGGWLFWDYHRGKSPEECEETSEGDVQDMDDVS